MKTKAITAVEDMRSSVNKGLHTDIIAGIVKYRVPIQAPAMMPTSQCLRILKAAKKQTTDVRKNGTPRNAKKNKLPKIHGKNPPS